MKIIRSADKIFRNLFYFFQVLDPKSPNRYPDVDEINIIVPEELFRKYTETDSRATSPIPIVMPKKILAERSADKSQLILDFGRSRSQQSSIKFTVINHCIYITYYFNNYLIH